MKNTREASRLKRRARIKGRLLANTNKPRLVIHRSLNNLYAQLVDDNTQKTIFSLSTQNKEIKAKLPTAGNIKAAQLFAEVFAKLAKEKGIIKIVFDRAGYLYQGRIKTFADALRKAGLEF